LARFRSSIKIDLDGRFELREGALKSIQVDGDVYAFLVGHGMGPGQSASDVLRQALFRAVDIDDDLYAYLLSLASSPGETANAILRRELPFTQIRRRSVHCRVRFHIPAGTGWDLGIRDHPVRVVGQTLQIYNDDNVNHRLHTDGFLPHPAADTAPGTFADFVLHDVFDLDTNPGLYDHDVGPTARFWINARPLRRAFKALAMFAFDRSLRHPRDVAHSEPKFSTPETGHRGSPSSTSGAPSNSDRHP
jgi:hypothetical protein